MSNKLKLISLCTALFSLPTMANWQLDNQASNLSFITTKAEHIAEVHTFNKLSGQLDKSGSVSFEIDLASVDTLIGIRDERMQKYLFNTVNFPKLIFSAQVDYALLKVMKVGESQKMTVAGKLNLHGQEQAVSSELMVTKLNGNNLLVNNVKPIIIQANQYDLVKGVDKLRELAGLASISYAVPVTFNLQFKAQ